MAFICEIKTTLAEQVILWILILWIRSSADSLCIIVKPEIILY
uniref:Uncharacterized protein n=1 Tax=Tetranychus urticae TaxID=32264 RepID=T1KCR4_TETUR